MMTQSEHSRHAGDDDDAGNNDDDGGGAPPKSRKTNKTQKQNDHRLSYAHPSEIDMILVQTFQINPN